MLRLLTDENVHKDIVRGLRRQLPELDVVRVQDAGLGNTDDPIILEWAAQAERILITRDRKTMISFAYGRVRAGKPMPGVFVLKSAMSIGQAISEILLIAECSLPDEWRDRVEFLPL